MKKDVVFFTIADQSNLGYATNLRNSFRKFHKDIPFEIVTGEVLDGYLKEDPGFFYRATPILGEKYLKEYELVVKMDADSIVFGDLSYIWKTLDYDVGTVMNWNRVDPQKYGQVMFQGIAPFEYMNCGFVAMRSEKFVHDWKNLCYTPQYDRSRYKEQDMLNVMVYYGNWNVRCFDHTDKIGGMIAWWGLIVKGELHRAELRGEKIYIPKGLGDTPFPPVDMEVKVVHAGGGNQPNKMNFHTWVNEEVGKRIEYLISDNEKKTI